MEIVFGAWRCSFSCAPIYPSEVGKRLLVAALRKFGKFSWRFGCLFESPIFVLWGGVHKSANPRKSFVWHWIAGIANSVRLSMYSNHNLDLGLTVVTSSDVKTNIIIFVLDSLARTRFWMGSGFVCIKTIVGGLRFVLILAIAHLFLRRE